MYLQIRYIPWLVKTLSIITNLGSPATYVLVSILVFIGLGWKRRWLEAGFSRIYLNVHYTSDVLAGYGFGLLLLAVNRWVMMKTRQVFPRAGDADSDHDSV